MKKPIILRRAVNPKEIYYITLHHTADSSIKTKKGLDNRLAYYEKLHKAKEYASAKEENRNPVMTDGVYGFKWVKYTLAIADGVARFVQHPKNITWHSSDLCLKKHSTNLHGMAATLIGNFMNRMPSEKQLATLVAAWGELEKKFKLDLNVTYHRKQGIKCGAPTACPGKKFIEWYEKGGRAKLVKWVNEYKKTGKLPFGYKVKVEFPYIFIEEDNPTPSACEDKLKQAEETIKRLQSEKEEFIKQVDKLRGIIDTLKQENEEKTENLKSCGKEIDRLNAELKVVKTDLKECRKGAEFCVKAKNSVAKILKPIIRWLSEINIVVFFIKKTGEYYTDKKDIKE